MKIVLRILGVLVIVLLVAIAGFGIYVARTWDRVYDEVPLVDVQISTDPAVIARGEYLVYGPAHCVACHGASVDGAPSTEAKPLLSGGMEFPLLPLGTLHAPNLTPDVETGIGRYSDAQIARMMRYAVKPNGRATLEPLMPFGNMSDDDLVAVISFLRSQPPVRNPIPDPEWTTMGKVIRSVSGVFKPRESINPPATAPAQTATKERGEYLARYVSNCVGCHTPRDETTFAAIGPDFSGGMRMEPAPLPDADRSVWFVTPNITPKAGSALMKFPDRDTFVARFKTGGRQYPGSPMPWEMFAMMDAADIGALYEFLHSLQPHDGPSGDPTFKAE